MKYEKHIFICTNEREDKSRKCCGNAHGHELVVEFKRMLKEKGLQGKMRAQRAGCLDACEAGPSLVVYPEGVFYGNVSKDDIREIVEEHMVKNCPVKRLVVDYKPE